MTYLWFAKLRSGGSNAALAQRSISKNHEAPTKLSPRDGEEVVTREASASKSPKEEALTWGDHGGLFVLFFFLGVVGVGWVVGWWELCHFFFGQPSIFGRIFFVT